MKLDSEKREYKLRARKGKYRIRWEEPKPLKRPQKAESKPDLELVFEPSQTSAEVKKDSQTSAGEQNPVEIALKSLESGGNKECQSVCYLHSIQCEKPPADHQQRYMQATWHSHLLPIDDPDETEEECTWSEGEDWTADKWFQ